jgi:hypothetical protein
VRLWNLSAGLLALVVVACGGATGTMDPETQGTLTVPLVSPAPDGKVYRLVGATFEIAGPQTVTLTDTSADTVQTVLTAGAYTVELKGPWHLERMDEPGKTVPVQLLSPNLLPFSVTKGRISEVRFLFKLPGEGSANVGFRVDGGGWLAGTFHFNTLDSGGPTSPLAELVGQDVPFVISFESSMVNKDSYSKSVQVQTGPTVVQFGGPHSAVLERVAKSLEGTPLFFSLRVVSGAISFDGLGYASYSGGYRIEMFPTPPFPGEVDPEGYPALRSFEFSTEATLRDDSSGSSVRGPTDVNGSN